MSTVISKEARDGVNQGGAGGAAGAGDGAGAGGGAGDILDSREAGGRFLRGGGMRVVAYGSGLALGLVSTPLVTRHLGSANWGRFVTVTSLVFIVAALTEGGVGNLGVREFATAEDDVRRAFMRNLIGLRIVLTLLGAAGAMAFVLLAGYPQVLVEGTALACVGLMLSALQITLAIPLTAQLRLGWLALSDFLGQFVTAAAMIVLVVVGASLIPFYAVAALTALATLTLTAVLVRSQINPLPAFAPAQWRSLLSQSFVYAAATAVGVVYFRVVVIAMSLLASSKQTGNFGLSFRVLDLINGVPWLLVASAFPILSRAARDDEERLRYALQRLFDGSIVVGGLFSLCVVIGGPFAVQVVGGPKYALAVVPLQIMGAGLIGTFLVVTWSYTLLTLRLFRELIFVNTLLVLLAVALSVILIPAYQARGGAIVTATLEIALAAGYALVLIRRRPELRPSLAGVPRVALALAAAFAVGALLPAPSAIATIVAALVLVTALAALRALPAEFLDALRGRSPIR